MHNAPSARLEVLREATPEQAGHFFATVPATALVEAVNGATDDELLPLIARDEVRPAAVVGVLARLDEFAIQERLERVTGVVRFDLERQGELLERQSVEFRGGKLRLVEDPQGTPADVVLTTSVLRFVRLISGQRNAGLEFLGGNLDITGDAALALAVGGVFKIPGQDAVAVDPTLLDPVDVATVLKGVRTEHLHKVMSGDFRPIVLGEIFRRLPDFIDPKRSARMNLTVGFRLTGRSDDTVERYVVAVDHGTCTVTEGDQGSDRDATVTCEGYDFLRLATGHLNPLTGVLRGQLKVRGDRAKALLLSSVMNIPEARA